MTRHVFLLLGGEQMLIRVLGSAAGGGFPQWNCNCFNCRRVRDTSHNTNNTKPLHARMNASLAISDNGYSWYIINATPDICQQIESHSAFLNRGSHNIRETPIIGILLTDAELDHTIGLLNIRNGATKIYATHPVLNALSEAFPVRQILKPYAKFRWKVIHCGESFPIFGGRLTINPFYLGCKPPRYTQMMDDRHVWEVADWVIGYRIVDQWTGGVVVYAPGIEEWTEELDRSLRHADCVFIDGTFWHADELRNLGISHLTADDMGHLPISGSAGSLERLSNITALRKVYIHINNTNPILDTQSSQYHILNELGIEVGYDGMELEV